MRMGRLGHPIIADEIKLTKRGIQTMKPLEGIKVIELAEYVAVPGAPRLLADWGATVYKIERPQGDPSRHLGPSFKMIDFMKAC